MSDNKSATFAIGQKSILEFMVTDDELAAFATLSGDFNPIHTNSDYACARGYPRPLVFGAFLIAKLSHIIGMHLPGPQGLWSSLQIDFRQPLFVNEPATVEAELVQFSEGTRSLLLKFAIKSDDKLIANGRTLATLHPSSLPNNLEKT